MTQLPHIIESAQPFLDELTRKAQTELQLPVLAVYAVDDYDYQDDKPIYSLQIVAPDATDWRKLIKNKPFSLKFGDWAGKITLLFMDKFQDRWATTHLFSETEWEHYIKTGSRE